MLYESIKTGKKKIVKKESSEKVDLGLDKDIDRMIEVSEKKIEKQVDLTEKNSKVLSRRSGSTEECFRYLDEQIELIKEDETKKK